MEVISNFVHYGSAPYVIKKMNYKLLKSILKNPMPPRETVLIRFGFPDQNT
jgi:hypothetical protein